MTLFHKLFAFTILVTFLVSCGNKSTNPNDYFGIMIQDEKKSYTTQDAIQVTLQNKKNKTIESVSYSLGDNTTDISVENTTQTIPLTNQKMGIQSLKASITAEGESYTISKEITITALETPKIYGYNILETYPHDINAFTQGLEFKNDTLYESTGQRGKSSLRKTSYQTGEVLKNVTVPNQFFAEGITILNDKIYQLTWQRNTGFVYDLASMEKSSSFVYGESKEGWGLCNDGEKLFKSDGTEKIWTLDPDTLAEKDHIQIYTNKSKIPRVNELEWVDGKIYANIWKQDAIAIVNPNSGAVEGVINLKGLQEKVTQHETLDVLNGIAYKGEPNILYVTGKHWDKLFKIEVVEE